MKRPLRFKLDAYRLYTYCNMTPMQAFAEAGRLNDCTLSGCMTTKAYASGYMSDDIKNFLRKKLAVGNEEISAYLKEFSIAMK